MWSCVFLPFTELGNVLWCSVWKQFDIFCIFLYATFIARSLYGVVVSISLCYASGRRVPCVVITNTVTQFCFARFSFCSSKVGCNFDPLGKIGENKSYMH